jgi:Icc-related predicted phosphoesterase
MEVRELRKTVSELQNSISILLGNVTARSSNIGNAYPDYKTAIQELAKKYEGTAEWGVLQVGNIIDLRSAFIIGQGIKLVPKDKGSREYKFIQEFIEYNNLDEEMPQDLAKEAEIEGRCLVKLIPNKEKKQIDIRFISYSANNYKVVTATGDYQKYEKVTYQDVETKSEINLTDEQFVYKKFAGRLSKVNDLMPKTAKVLTQCENLDKALYDWRKINNLFASPTPVVECTGEADAKGIAETLEKIKWNVGKLLVIKNAVYKLVGADAVGTTALEKEIIALAKVISGATGVPVHFLGYPDLMSNRAVSTDLFEFINASCSKERSIWVGFYEELFNKALVMSSAFNTGYKENTVKAQILQITEAKLQELANVWLPLYNANVIDLDYMLSKIPDADPEKIKKANEESAVKMLEAIKKQEASQLAPAEGVAA